MSQGRNSTNGETGCKGTESPDGSETVTLERLESDGEQTLIGFSGPGIDGAALALSDSDVDVDEATRLVEDVVDAMSEDTVVVDDETARAALLEVEAAIERTGGPNVGVEAACSPLAAAYDELANNPNLADKGCVLGTLERIGRERGVDVHGADPLTDMTFRARNRLQEALEDAGTDDTDDDGPVPLTADGGWEVTD